MKKMLENETTLTNGYWHKHTATIDWCESNYAITEYVAEFWNTASNLVIILFPLTSLWWCFLHHKHRNQEQNRHKRSLIFKIPFTLIACNVGLSLVGVGSWMFHMTLKYEMQLLDELPMLYGSGVLIYTNYDLIVASFEYDLILLEQMVNRNERNGYLETKKFLVKLNKLKPVVFVLTSFYCLLFTYVYLMVWHNPIFHEVTYALMVLVLMVQTATLIHRFQMPKRLYLLSMLYYFIGFALWNVDNRFCHYLRDYRQNIERMFSLNDSENSYNNWRAIWFNVVAISLKSVSEFHAWWHIFTGYAAFMAILFITEVYYQDHINRNDLNRIGKRIRPVQSKWCDLYYYLTDNLMIQNEKAFK